MLGPYLTTENLFEVLARARHRTKKEIGRLVRMLDPLPDVPSRIDPLGPGPTQLVPAAPTWSHFVGSMNPARELAPGNRPLDWTEDTVEEPAGDRCRARGELALPVGSAPAPAELALPDEAALARLTPLRFMVQFTASEEYVELVEKAKALLSDSAARPGLDEIHLRAMRALVAELERQRYAVTARPQQSARATSTPAPPMREAHQAREPFGGGRSNPKCESESASKSERAAEPEPVHLAERGQPRWRGRYVPAAVRRAVFARDQGRCTCTGDSGQRCRETSGLELHHLRAFAHGGQHTEENLTLRCRAHNDLAAEKDFGRDYIELVRDSTEHDSWATHEAARDNARAGLR
jgi:5-methylcytosine-specific restriction endonuclease McrA